MMNTQRLVGGFDGLGRHVKLERGRAVREDERFLSMCGNVVRGDGRPVGPKLWSKPAGQEKGRGCAARFSAPEELGAETNTSAVAEQEVHQAIFGAAFFLRSCAALGRLGAC
jgi:hypothetical protein